MSDTKNHIHIRHPAVDEGLGLYQLVKACPPLDLNSTYLYHLISQHFRKSSFVAEIDGEIAGLISGYRLPEEANVYFIWQVAVHDKHKGKGMAGALLRHIENWSKEQAVDTWHTTVTSDNQASLALFSSFCRKTDRDLVKRGDFVPAEGFEAEGHLPEELYEIKL